MVPAAQYRFQGRCRLSAGEADVDRAQQTEMANLFLARHRGPPVLLLPNVWDALSARLFVAAGFDALATTSGGVARALGYPDGELAPWAEVVAATARIVPSAQVPVSADIEAGYGATPAEVGAHVAAPIEGLGYVEAKGTSDRWEVLGLPPSRATA